MMVDGCFRKPEVASANHPYAIVESRRIPVRSLPRTGITPSSSPRISWKAYPASATARFSLPPMQLPNAGIRGAHRFCRQGWRLPSVCHASAEEPCRAAQCCLTSLQRQLSTFVSPKVASQFPAPPRSAPFRFPRCGKDSRNEMALTQKQIWGSLDAENRPSHISLGRCRLPGRSSSTS